MPVAVAIVEDDSGYAEGIQFLLDHSDEFRCVAVCPSAEEALVKLPPLRPHVVLMDIRLKAASGIECVAGLKRLLPDTKVLMLTVFEDYERVYQSLKAGASGYLLKRSTPQELLNAIRELLAGGSPMSTAIARLVVDAFREFAPPPGAADVLTSRERDVLTALAAGRRYKEVADQIGVSYHTVRTHINNIYTKLQVHSVVAALAKTRAKR
jgi:DNA-binding NarL/FixJ family response regulator